MHKIVLGAILLLLFATFYSLIGIIAVSGVQEKNEPEVSVPKTPVIADAHVEKAPVSIADKKTRFIEGILPSVRKVKSRLDADYRKAVSIAGTPESNRTPLEAEWLHEQMQAYKVDGITCLLHRMHTHPVSLVVAQAALETGWGSSRFYRVANNVFGIWSYHKDEPRIAASKTRGKKTVYVKKFDSLDAAVEGYFKMISSGYAYASFRRARMNTDNPFELLRYLRKYSELRDEYVARLYYVIRANRLYRYDDPSYEPMALASILPEYVAERRAAAAEKKKRLERQMLALNEVKMLATDRNVTMPCSEEKITRAQAPSKAVPARSSLP